MANPVDRRTILSYAVATVASTITVGCGRGQASAQTSSVPAQQPAKPTSGGTMSNEVTPLTTESLHLIAVHDSATLRDLSGKIQQHVDATIKLLRETQTKFGRCVVIYWDEGGPKPLLMTEAGCPIDVGWEVDPSFRGDGSNILPVDTPSGKVATATHIGPYDQVGKAHQAIVKWSVEHHQKIAGPNWEVYDHPRPGEPSRVDVFYLIG